jgi:hypothetical protein
MAFNPNQVVLDGFTQHDFAFTMLISGTVTSADLGKAVTLDTTAPATVKLAGDGDPIYGRIFQIEDRSQEGVTTCTVETRFRKRLPKSAAAITLGASVVGAGAGLVKAGVASSKNIVLFVDEDADYVIVEQ